MTKAEFMTFIEDVPDHFEMLLIVDYFRELDVENVEINTNKECILIKG